MGLLLIGVSFAPNSSSAAASCNTIQRRQERGSRIKNVDDGLVPTLTGLGRQAGYALDILII
jgi:hypothetical protein